MMGTINYFELFGKPISHPDVQQLITQYGLVDEFKDIMTNVERDLAQEISGYISKRVHFEHHDSGYLISANQVALSDSGCKNG